MKLAEFALYLRITDGPALVAAARERLVEERVVEDLEAATEEIEDEDYSQALRILLDPGESPPGTEILDSVCEEG